MTKGNKMTLLLAILMIVVIWYLTEQGIIGKKRNALDGVGQYSFGSMTPSTGQLLLSGCTDPNALNYDTSAAVDNGLCFYVQGCCDVNASNYDPMADSCHVPNNNVITCNYS